MPNRELIEALYEGFARFDAPAMVGALDERVEWTEAEGFPYAGTHVGPQAMLDNVWTRMATEWSRWAAIPDRIIVEDDRVAVVGTYTATYRATGSPSGRGLPTCLSYGTSRSCGWSSS